MNVFYEPLEREYTDFTLVISDHDLKWTFNSVLVVLKEPKILGY